MRQGASAISVEWELLYVLVFTDSLQDPGSTVLDVLQILDVLPRTPNELNYNSAVLRRQKHGQASLHLDGSEWDRVWRCFRGDELMQRCFIWSLKVSWESNQTPRFVTEGERVTTSPSKVNWDCVLSNSIVAGDRAEGTRFCKLCTTL